MKLYAGRVGSPREGVCEFSFVPGTGRSRMRMLRSDRMEEFHVALDETLPTGLVEVGPDPEGTAALMTAGCTTMNVTPMCLAESSGLRY